MWQHRATNCGFVCAEWVFCHDCGGDTRCPVTGDRAWWKLWTSKRVTSSTLLPALLHHLLYLQDISRRAGSLGLRPLHVIVPNGPPNSPSLSLLYKCWRGNRTRLNYSNKNNGLFCAATAFVICSPKRGLTHGWLTMGWGGRSSEIKRWEIAHRCCTFFFGTPFKPI